MTVRATHAPLSVDSLWSGTRASCLARISHCGPWQGSSYKGMMRSNAGTSLLEKSLMPTARGVAQSFPPGGKERGLVQTCPAAIHEPLSVNSLCSARVPLQRDGAFERAPQLFMNRYGILALLSKGPATRGWRVQTCPQSKVLIKPHTGKEKPHPSTATEGRKPCGTKCRRLGGLRQTCPVAIHEPLSVISLCSGTRAGCLSRISQCGPWQGSRYKGMVRSNVP